MEAMLSGPLIVVCVSLAALAPPSFISSTMGRLHSSLFDFLPDRESAGEAEVLLQGKLDGARGRVAEVKHYCLLLLV